MKRIILFVSIVLFLVMIVFLSTKPNYKYTITGKIYIPTSGPSGLHDWTWQCDSIFYIQDTCCYLTKDGTIIKISPPYKIQKNY